MSPFWQTLIVILAFQFAVGYLATWLSVRLILSPPMLARFFSSKTRFHFLSEETFTRLIRHFITTAEHRLKQRGNIRRLYRIADVIIPSLLHDFIHNSLEDLDEGKNDHLENLIRRFYRRALPKLHIDYSHAEFGVNIVFSTLVTPSYIRKSMVDSLSDDRILHIESVVLSQMPFWQSLLAKLLDLKKIFSLFREYLEQHPAEADQLILEMLDQLEVREHMTDAIAAFEPHKMDDETQQAVAAYLGTATTQLLVDHMNDLADLAKNLSPKSRRAITKALLKADYKTWLAARYPGYENGLARWISELLRNNQHRWLKPVLGYAATTTLVPYLTFICLIVGGINALLTLLLLLLAQLMHTL